MDKNLQLLGYGLTMSSLEIADLTGKRHDNVLSDIRTQLYIGLYGVVFDNSKISYPPIQGLSAVTDGHTKRTKEVLLDREHTLTLITGYDVKIRHTINKRWIELEAAHSTRFNLPDFTNPADAAIAWAEQYRATQAALAQIEADKPKVEFAMAVRNLAGSCLVEELAKTLGIGRNTFFKQLREGGYLMVTNLPYQKYIDAGWFTVIENTPFTDSKGKSHPTFTTRITGRGQVALEKKFRPMKEAA